LVGADDIGKVFACIGALQTSVSLISPLYNLMYVATLEWHLGFVYCFSETILLVMIAVAAYTYFYIRKYGPKEVCAKDENGNENHGFKLDEKSVIPEKSKSQE
jgi:hypothetical protein